MESAPSARERCDALRQELGCSPDTIVGHSEALADALEELAMVARSPLHVVLLGPTGVGKSTFARVLHEASRRRGEFVPVNCASLVPSLADSMLYGHARGAYTGAEQAAEGLVAQAHGGTLFLDEVGDLVPEVQAKFLTFLDRGYIRGLHQKERPVDVRIVAATNRDIDAVLRSDLIHRIDQYRIRIPSLDERLDDIEVLAEAALERSAQRAGLPMLHLAPDALEGLVSRRWPGNVRELAYVLLAGELRARRARSARIRFEHLFPRDERPPAGTWRHREDSRKRVEICEALRQSGGRVDVAAQKLGVKRSTLYEWMSRLQIRPRQAP